MVEEMKGKPWPGVLGVQHPLQSACCCLYLRAFPVCSGHTLGRFLHLPTMHAAQCVLSTMLTLLFTVLLMPVPWLLWPWGWWSGKWTPGSCCTDSPLPGHCSNRSRMLSFSHWPKHVLFRPAMSSCLTSAPAPPTRSPRHTLGPQDHFGLLSPTCLTWLLYLHQTFP